MYNCVGIFKILNFGRMEYIYIERERERGGGERRGGSGGEGRRVRVNAPPPPTHPPPHPQGGAEGRPAGWGRGGALPPLNIYIYIYI